MKKKGKTHETWYAAVAAPKMKVSGNSTVSDEVVLAQARVATIDRQARNMLTLFVINEEDSPSQWCQFADDVGSKEGVSVLP